MNLRHVACVVDSKKKPSGKGVTMSNMTATARGAGAVLGSLTAVLVAACSPTSDNTPAQQQLQNSALVTTKDITGVGTVLVDRSGNTLYFTDADQGGIRCTGQCADIWPPVTADPDIHIDGLGSVKRPDDGVQQLTYMDRPLYAFTMDTTAQPASGNNARDSFDGTAFIWHAAIVPSASSAPNTPPDDGGGGGGGY
jgi:predicted lipoprotein with Yx(FWY)xxD motif